MSDPRPAVADLYVSTLASGIVELFAERVEYRLTRGDGWTVERIGDGDSDPIAWRATKREAVAVARADWKRRTEDAG